MKARAVPAAGVGFWSIALDCADSDDGVDLEDLFVTSRQHADAIAAAWNAAVAARPVKAAPPPLPVKAPRLKLPPELPSPMPGRKP